MPFRFLMPKRRKWGCHFFTNWFPWQRPLRYRKEKRGPDRSFAPKTLSFGEKIAKISLVDPEIICLREIIKKKMKKKEKRKKLTQAKYIARLAT